MGMTRLLLALHPRRWRERYGEEYAALLEDSALSPAVLADVLAHCAKLHAGAHRRLLALSAAVALSVLGEVLARTGHLSDNILWAPATPAKGLALAATTGPWLALVGGAAARRRPRRGRPGAGADSRC